MMRSPCFSIISQAALQWNRESKIPRNGSGVYSAPANTEAVSLDPISSSKFNTLVADLVSDANTDRPIVAGGTGASSAAGARVNLGLELGVDAQDFHAKLDALSGLTGGANEIPYFDGTDTMNTFTGSGRFRTFAGAATVAAQRTDLGLGDAATQAFLDEDNMASNSASAAASQQSIVAYVAAQIALTNRNVAGSYTSISGTTPTMESEFGFASVSRVTLGVYRYTFDTAEADTNYIVEAHQQVASGSTVRYYCGVYAKTTTTVDIAIQDVTGTFIDVDHSVIVKRI